MSEHWSCAEDAVEGRQVGLKEKGQLLAMEAVYALLAFLEELELVLQFCVLTIAALQVFSFVQSCVSEKFCPLHDGDYKSLLN